MPQDGVFSCLPLHNGLQPSEGVSPKPSSITDNVSFVHFVRRMRNVIDMLLIYSVYKFLLHVHLFIGVHTVWGEGAP